MSSLEPSTSTDWNGKGMRVPIAASNRAAELIHVDRCVQAELASKLALERGQMGRYRTSQLAVIHTDLCRQLLLRN